MSRDWTGSFVYAWSIGTVCLVIALALLLVTPRPVRETQAPRPEPEPTFACLRQAPSPATRRAGGEVNYPRPASLGPVIDTGRCSRRQP